MFTCNILRPISDLFCGRCCCINKLQHDTFLFPWSPKANKYLMSFHLNVIWLNSGLSSNCWTMKLPEQTDRLSSICCPVRWRTEWGRSSSCWSARPFTCRYVSDVCLYLPVSLDWNTRQLKFKDSLVDLTARLISEWMWGSCNEEPDSVQRVFKV